MYKGNASSGPESLWPGSNYRRFSNSAPPILTAGFDEPVLYRAARVDRPHPCNYLKIITAFTDTERISTHMIKLSEGIKNKRFIDNIKVEILLGMTKSSLSIKKHEDICRLLKFLNNSRDMPHVSCRYISSGPEVHSKIYVWSAPDDELGELPRIAYCGSLNYTMNAFYKRRESVCFCRPSSAMKYYEELYLDSIDCYDPSVTEKLKNVINAGPDEDAGPDNSELEYMEYDQMVPVASIRVSLLEADGEKTGHGSGVNWGIRQNATKRNTDQAYIPYNVKDRIPGFFPGRVHPDDKNCPMFRVITKDFGSFHMRLAQGVPGAEKAIQSVESNAILGEWFRKRLGVQPGFFITKQMLEKYGKTYVTFRKFKSDDGNVYLLDF